MKIKKIANYLTLLILLCGCQANQKSSQKYYEYVWLNNINKPIYFNQDENNIIKIISGDIVLGENSCYENKDYHCLFFSGFLYLAIPQKTNNVINSSYGFNGIEFSFLAIENITCDNFKVGKKYVVQSQIPENLADENNIIRFSYNDCTGLEFFAFGELLSEVLDEEKFFHPKSVYIAKSINQQFKL